MIQEFWMNRNNYKNHFWQLKKWDSAFVHWKRISIKPIKCWCKNGQSNRYVLDLNNFFLSLENIFYSRKSSFFLQIISLEIKIIYLGQENIGFSVFRPIFS